jgi:hypothetical protein
MTVIIGQGGPFDPVALQLQTRQRRHIDNEVRLDRAPESMRAAVEIITGNYPDAELLSATALYNCFGLAFASRRCWIMDGNEVQKVLDDDGFHPLPWDPQFWQPGDVVLYRTENDPISHVAVIVEKRANLETPEFSVRVVSAWGHNGEYLHPISTKSPLLGEPYKVMSQRQ